MTVIRDKNNIPNLIEDLKVEENRMLKKAGAYLEGQIKEKITQGDPDWPPLDPKTIKQKGSTKPLIDTGDMRARVMHEVGAGVVHVGIFKGDVAEYAAVQEFGSRKNNIPQRSFMRSTFDEEVDNLDRLISNELDRIIDENVFTSRGGINIQFLDILMG